MGKQTSKRIIGGIEYDLRENYLLCVGYNSNPALIVDLQAVTKKLYYPKRKAFIIDTMGEFYAQPKAVIVTESEARNFLDEFSSGIIRENYIRLLGKPKE